MGDVRFVRAFEALREAPDRREALRTMPDEEVVAALAHASRAADPFLTNVLATEAANRTRRLRTLVQHLGEGVFTTDADGRVSLANPAAGRLLGCEDAELLGRDAYEALCVEDPTGRRLPPQECPVERARAAAAAVAADGIVLRRLDGGTFFAAYVAAPILRDDEFDGAVVAFRDESDRRRAEEALRRSERQWRTFVEVSPHPVAVHAEGVLVYVNPAALAVLGARSSDEVLGRRVLDFVHPESLPLVLARIRHAATTGEAVPRAVERLLRLDGSDFWAEVAGVPMAWEGRPALQLALRDVTHERPA